MRSRFILSVVTLSSLLAGQALFAQTARRPQPDSTPRRRSERKEPERKRTDPARRRNAAAPPASAASKPATPGPAAPRATATAPKPAPRSRPTSAAGSALAEADRAYDAKSYAVALPKYREAVRLKQVSAVRVAQVDLRIAECLEKTGQWDAALAEGQKLLAKHAGGLWAARTRAWLMALYLNVPHSGWETGTRIIRGGDAPETPDEAPAERVNLREEDLTRALEHGEQARALYEQIRPDLKKQKGNTEEEAAHSADLARAISRVRLTAWAAARQWPATTDPVWKLDADAAYDPTWAPPKKVLQLFLYAEKLGTDAQKPLARLAQGHWLRGYQQLMPRFARQQDENRQWKSIPFPYQERFPHETLRSLTKDYPAHPEADRARITVAIWLQEDGKAASALQAVQQYQKDNPKGKWASLARAMEQAITRLELRVQNPQPTAPGAKAKLEVFSRNIETLKFTANRVKLEELVRDARVVARPQPGVGDLLTLLGKRKGLAKFYQGEPVTWEVKPEAKAAYLSVDQTVETPLDSNGAWVVEIDGGPVRKTVLLIISDLAVIQVVERERIHAMVVNAATGAPVPEASALIREVYTPEGEGNQKPKVSAATAPTDADGLAMKPLAPKRQESTDILTFAWKGDRYALTGSTAQYSWSRREVADRKAYVYTERPVYRPGQVVYYRALLAGRGEDGAFLPARGQKVRVKVFDPRGAEVGSQELQAGEFGSASGQLQLGSDPALGMYRVQVLSLGQAEPQPFGAGSFRVEEYKKPEFEVTVKGPDTPARVGDKINVRINARYYFGAPVAGAKVSYRVMQDEWIPVTPFAIPYSFLYSSADHSQERPWWREDYVPFPAGRVATGEATTDASGNATVQVETVPKDPRLQGRHVRYTVHAEVTDASRRTIEGEGEVRALASQFNAFVRMRQGFYGAGDRLQADVRVQDSEGRPLAVEGTARILRMVVKEGKIVGEEVFKQPLKTDAQGRAEITWPAAQSGHYDVRFEARDAWEQLVVGSENAWVAGEGAGAGVFRNRHVLLVPEQTSYRIGQKARVLLVSDEPDNTVLLTQEAGDRILEKRVIRMTGRSMVVEVPLKREHSPDVVLAVTGIRSRELFRSEARLYVPPAEQLLTMEVSADKPQYKPGEKASLKIRARDVDGKPVRTEASVGIVDASVFYIAGDATDPIASFFYAEERGSELDAQESITARFADLGEDDQPEIKWDGPEWGFPDGLGSLEDDMILASAGEGREAARQMRPAAAMAARAGGGYPGGSAGAAGAVPAELAEFREKAKDVVMSIPAPRADLDRVRSNFADTAFWSPAVVTNAQGEATVEVTWPDNLTQWRATTRGWTQSAQVGEAFTDVTTSKDLLVRLQAPRFFVERDEVVLSANVHNYTQADQRIRVQLQLGGDTLYPASSSPSGPPRPRPLNVPRPDRPMPVSTGEPAAETTRDESLEQWVEVPKGGEKRLDWRVRVERPGDARVRVLADSGSETDAVELGFPVYTHGVEKLVVKGGSLLMAPGEKPGTKSAKLSVDLPLERATDSGELIVQVNPSVAAAMLDALPYVVDYPYGCVEQTMSRFLPSVVSAKTLTDLGLSLEDLRAKSLVEYERIKAQSPKDRLEKSGYTYPEGTPGLRSVQDQALNTWSWRAHKSPVYNPQVLNKMVADGLARLRQFQNPDGGWGWWKNDQSDPQITAYVVQGLITGKGAGMQAPGEMLTRGLAFLDKAFAKEADLHDLTYLGWVMSLDPARAKRVGPVLLEKAYGKRDKLSAYGLSLLALALHQSGKAAEAKICVENLENTAKVDTAAGTCSWNRTGAYWWHWYNSPVETSAMCLRAFNRIAPKHRLTPMIVRWLSNRRSGDAWTSTKDTALAIQALAEYIKTNRELAPDYTVTVDVAGQYQRKFKVNAENSLLFDNRLVVPAPALGNGPQTVTVTREGQGNLYYSAYLRYFTLEEGIQGTGNEIRVRRRYFRLTKPEAGAKLPKDAPVTQDGYVRSLVRPGQKLISGDLLEVELLLESKNDYSYLVFEDMKPAGCEPVDLRSGGRYADGLCSNMELRDEKVAFFITHLPQGKRMLSYRLRAEIPGAFHALPLNGYAMYAPDIRCISDEGSFGIEDAAPARAASR